MSPTSYDRWVHTQPHRGSPRIFRSDLLERFTLCPWWYVPLWSVPVAAYLLASSGLGRIDMLSAALTGLALWHAIEYLLHRFVFHMQPSTTSGHFNACHFLLHGERGTPRMYHRRPSALGTRKTMWRSQMPSTRT